MWIDEAFTPDSSRYWDAGQYAPGRGQPSFDKQFVRDWLDSTGWDKRPPAPKLPEGVVRTTREKYLDAYRKLTDAMPEHLEPLVGAEHDPTGASREPGRATRAAPTADCRKSSDRNADTRSTGRQSRSGNAEASPALPEGR